MTTGRDRWNDQVEVALTRLSVQVERVERDRTHLGYRTPLVRWTVTATLDGAEAMEPAEFLTRHDAEAFEADSAAAEYLQAAYDDHHHRDPVLSAALQCADHAPASAVRA